MEYVDEDDDQFCPHFGDGTPKSLCSRCNGAEEADRKRRDTIKRELTARFSGRCPFCEEEFEAGTLIFETADGRYVCCRRGT